MSIVVDAFLNINRGARCGTSKIKPYYAMGIFALK